MRWGRAGEVSLGQVRGGPLGVGKGGTLGPGVVPTSASGGRVVVGPRPMPQASPLLPGARHRWGSFPRALPWG